jgi:DNA mismatch repair protein MutS2
MTQHALSHEHTHALRENELLALSLAELEFPKVVEYIAEFAFSELGADHIVRALPTPDTAWLRDEHTRVNEMTQMLSRGEIFPIDGLSDVRTLLQKSLITGAFLLPSEVLVVRDMVRASRLCKHFFAGQVQFMPMVCVMAEPLHENRLLEKHIAETMDDNGTIRDTASRELARIRREITDTTNRLRQRLQKLLKRVTDDDTAREEFITQREGRFVLPMKVEYKRNIPGIIHGVSQTGQTVFVEPAETFDMNNELSLLHNEEQREIERIMLVLTAELAQDARAFLQSLDILSHLDAVCAKARYANKYDGVKPDIVDNSEIELRAMRHPLLVHAKGVHSVVPLSITFGDGVQGHLISGPNAGGKTVALKCIGLSVAMTLAGFFPLGYCRTNYRAIFSAIGDKQSIEDDVSTFSSQMIRLREILSHCSQSALALIDEIAAGTDPQEGAALAVGTIESLVKRGAMFVVTTHQSSLKSYALSRSDISNASMAFNTDKMQPTSF